MKKIIITLIMAFKMTAVNADVIESNIPRHIGFGSGAYGRKIIDTTQVPDKRLK